MDALLGAIGLSFTDLDCEPDDRWNKIKHAFFKYALEHHPDKGGVASDFDEANTAFQKLRELTQNGAISVKDVSCGAVAASPLRATNLKPYAYYEAIARAAGTPPYRVEPALSGRSKCKSCKLPIAEADLRVGSLMPETGTYSHWHHIQCWRTPSAFKAVIGADVDVETAVRALDEVLITGLSVLPPPAMDRLVEHLSDESTYARETKAADASAAKANAAVNAVTNGDQDAPETEAESAALALPPTETSKLIDDFPDPKGQLSASTVVISGVFDLPDSKAVGLGQGKDKIRQLVAAYGAKITSAVSKRTKYLVVGDAPGAAKVAQANKFGTPVLNLAGLHSVLRGEEPAPVTINGFSTGFRGSGLANRLTNDELSELKERASCKRLAEPVPNPTNISPDVANLNEHALKKVKLDALQAAVA
jgi:hypothetical protein